MSVVELLQGPLWTASATIFVVFGLWRLAVMLFSDYRRLKGRSKDASSARVQRTFFGHALPATTYWGRGKMWFVTLSGYSFHVGLFALLLFGAPHVTFIRDHILGVGWAPLPRWGFIIAAEFSFAGLIALWVHRFVDPVARLISRPGDHLAAGLTFIVMLTGGMALGQQSVILRAVHLGVVELWLIYFPFSSLMHIFAWPFSRGITGLMRSRRGTRM